jgi:hypothetical protein
MRWIRERDSLIAQTMAFVQTVAGKKEDAVPAVGGIRLDTANPAIETASLDAIRNALDIVEAPREVLRKDALKTEALNSTLQSAPPKSVQTARPIVPSELQSEIKSRIESFRAHQERFNRERAEYFNATLARLRAAIDDTARINK